MNSKLTLGLDAGYIFDMLAIINVKINKCVGDKREKSILTFKQFSEEIQSQIGKVEFDRIISSEEYKALYEINLKTFLLVDKANNDNGLAGEVANANIERFHCKNKLQLKFFNETTSEIKV